MDQNTLLILESLSIAAFNVIAVYIAAISYSLPWASVLMVMVIVSFITASVVRLLLSKMNKKDLSNTTVSSIKSTVLIALISSFAIFIILSYRFNIPMALGISFLSGFLTALLRHLMK
jgi:fructose-specific phosphotransferase system IIC component